MKRELSTVPKFRYGDLRFPGSRVLQVVILRAAQFVALTASA